MHQLFGHFTKRLFKRQIMADKIGSPSFFIKEMQMHIEIMTRFHSTLIQDQQYQLLAKMRSDWREVPWYNHCCRALWQQSHVYTYDPGPTLRKVPKENKRPCPPTDMCKNVHGSFTLNMALKWIRSKRPPTRGWIDNLWYVHTVEGHVVMKNERHKPPLYVAIWISQIWHWVKEARQ